MTKRYSTADKPKWIPVNITDPALAKRLDGVLEARQKAKDLERQFQIQFLAAFKKKNKLEPGTTLAFGYNFGKFAIAVVEEKPAKATTNSSTFTL